MTEVPATVESEFVPEPKWPERVLVQQNGVFGIFTAVAEYIDEAERHAKKSGYAYRILRVAPPVERRVEIDWPGVIANASLPYLIGESFKKCVEDHARIVEGPKQ